MVGMLEVTRPVSRVLVTGANAPAGGVGLGFVRGGSGGDVQALSAVA